MSDPAVTPDTVRALIADTEPRAPLLPDGTMPLDSDGNCTACGWKTAAYVPDGPDHGPGCPADREYWRLVGARAATRSAAPAIALAYLDACAERDRLARVLAVEGGDESAAPPGWVASMGDWWRAGVIVLRVLNGWRVRFDGEVIGPTIYKSALEAMEAADRAGGSDV